MAVLRPLQLLLLALPLAATAHNITDILNGFPDYSLHNSYLSQTKLADDINSRQTITCLVLNNSALSALAAKHPLSFIKAALMIHVFLDYYDPQKLHQFSQGSGLTTTLYQTTGQASGMTGFVNITDLRGGKVAFRSASAGSDLANSSTYTKSVQLIPYNISVLEISGPIIVPWILTAPAPSPSEINITALLENAGCKTFASMLDSSGVLKNYQSAMDNGLTVFAPSDEAFTAPGIPDLSKLANEEVISLLQYQASADYIPKATLMATTGPISTLASNASGKFDLTATTEGDSVTLHTGVDSSRVADMVLDSTPVAIFKVEDLLLPGELFGEAPSPAPAQGPVTPPTPTPVWAPSPGPASKAPSPLDGAPSDAPEANSLKDIGGGHVTAASLFSVLLTIMFATVISPISLS